MKHGFLCYRNKQTFLIVKNVLIVMVPHLINTDVFEPSYNDFNIHDLNPQLLFTNLKIIHLAVQGLNLGTQHWELQNLSHWTTREYYTPCNDFLYWPLQEDKLAVSESSLKRSEKETEALNTGPLVFCCPAAKAISNSLLL